MSQPSKTPSNGQILTFMVVLCFACALVLSVLASMLYPEQQKQIALDQAKQILMSAKIYDPDNYFLMLDDEGNYVPAKAGENGVLVPGTKEDHPTPEEIFQVKEVRILPRLTDDEGKLYTFEEAGLNQEDYVEDNKKGGYADLKYKLLYLVAPNPTPDADPAAYDAYIFPVNGFGLWDAIYGYIAVSPNGDSVIGISWYDQKETPGLGAVIASPKWQAQFFNKVVFQEDSKGKTNFETAPMGITVVKGKVQDVYGSSPKANSAVDGIPGATLTGNGVTAAYKESLTPYREFLDKVHKKNANGDENA